MKKTSFLSISEIIGKFKKCQCYKRECLSDVFKRCGMWTSVLVIDVESMLSAETEQKEHSYLL